MNLYEIESKIMECVDMETGEIIDIEKLNELEIERDTKIENIALWIKNLNADAKALKEEKDNLYARQKACENKAESLKNYLNNFLQGEKYKSSKVSISYRDSKSVSVIDASKIPSEYLKYAEPTINKTDIKNALENGIEIDGAEIVTNTSIQIK